MGAAQQSRTSTPAEQGPSLGLTHICIYVLDQDAAKEFYLDKLGFVLRNDIVMGHGFEGAGQGFRWLTVSAPGQPGIEFILADPDMGHAPAEIRDLVAKGAMATTALSADDCRETFAELSARGVVFLQEPQERPYGIEAVFRDDSGNSFSLCEPTNPVPSKE